MHIESSVSWLLLSITEQIHCRFSVAVARAVAGAIDNIIAVIVVVVVVIKKEQYLLFLLLLIVFMSATLCVCCRLFLLLCFSLYFYLLLGFSSKFLLKFSSNLSKFFGVAFGNTLPTHYKLKIY